MSHEIQPDALAVYEKGSYTFMGIEMLVERGALIPRKETELLGREAVQLLDGHPGEPFVIDVCCGSGNLACAIAAHCPGSLVWATDLTPSCAALARKNVEHLKLDHRMKVFQGDLFEPLLDEARGRVDMIICNPPYISTGKLETERVALLEHEPREAFDGGPYGLAIHQRVIREAPLLLKPGGHLLFEFGLGQERQMKALFDRSKAYENVRFVHNGAGAARVVVAELPH